MMLFRNALGERLINEGIFVHISITDEKTMVAALPLLNNALKELTDGPLVLDIEGTALNESDIRRISDPLSRHGDSFYSKL